MEKKTAESQGARIQTPSILAYHDLKPYVYGQMNPKRGPESPSEKLTIPKDIVFYRSTSPLSLVIGVLPQENKPRPPPLFYISINMDNRVTNKRETPQIQLHNGPKEIYPVIGDVRFRRLTTSDITIPQTSQGNPLSKFNEATTNDLCIELAEKGALTTDVHSFSLDVPSSDGTIRERFEWRHSGGPEVKALATENAGKENYSGDDGGLKLVNVRTRELIAVFAGGKHHQVYSSMKITGKLRFMNLKQVDDDFRKVVVLSILSIMERGRRQAVSNASSCGRCTIL